MNTTRRPFSVTLRASGEIETTGCFGDHLAEYAVAGYHHVLNTPERRDQAHTGPDFAAAIRESYDCDGCPQNRAIAEHLETLKTIT